MKPINSAANASSRIRTHDGLPLREAIPLWFAFSSPLIGLIIGFLGASFVTWLKGRNVHDKRDREKYEHTARSSALVRPALRKRFTVLSDCGGLVRHGARDARQFTIAEERAPLRESRISDKKNRKN
jgi:hypothetical protein